MSESLGRSTTRYRTFVRRRADLAAQSWTTALQSRLPVDPATYDEQVQYWETLTVISLLNWTGADEEIEDSQRAAMRRYQEELDPGQDFPASAAYLLVNPSGEFLLRTIQAPEAEPLELIQRHVEVIQGKEAILHAINSFFTAIKETEQVNSEDDRPQGLVGKLTKQRNALIALKTTVQGMNRRLATAMRKPVSDATSWNIVTTNSVPAEFANHIAIRRMQEKVDAAKRKRATLENALNQVLGVETDDSPTAVRSAREGVQILLNTDPEDDFDVRQTRQLGKNLVLKLAWQDRSSRLNDLENVASDLLAIVEEQEALIESIKAVKCVASVCLGGMLSATEFWERVETGDSRNGRVTLIWEELVRAGNARELSKILGGKALFLEQARRRGQFEAGTDGVKDNVTTLLEHLLSNAETDFVSILSKSQSVCESFGALSQMLKTRNDWKVDQVADCLEQTLAPYRTLLHSGDVAIDRSTWPAKGQRVTLSRSAYNSLLEAARISDRLTHVVRWLQDSQRHAAVWWRLLEDLYRKIERTEPGPQQDRLKRELRDLAPDFPDYLVPGYEPQVPPLLGSSNHAG